MSKETIFINLFGGPGTGKSTLCAGIFTLLKVKGIDCEMALEYAKDVVWEESFPKLKNQIYIFAKQHSRVFRLNGKVDVVITDSPLINSIVYNPDGNRYLDDLVLFEFSKLKCMNYFLVRGTNYNPNGRVHNIEEAKKIDEKYKSILDDNKVEYNNIIIDTDNAENIVKDIIYLLEHQ